MGVINFHTGRVNRLHDTAAGSQRRFYRQRDILYFTLFLCCSTAVTAVWTGPLLLASCCQEPSQDVDTDCLHLQLVVSAAGRTPESAAQPVTRLHPLVWIDRVCEEL